MTDSSPRLSLKMACGHFADTLDEDGQPYCSACLGSIDAWIVTAIPGQERRSARCTDCGQVRPGPALDLPFYRYRDDAGTDSFYCGCRGLSN